MKYASCSTSSEYVYDYIRARSVAICLRELHVRSSIHIISLCFDNLLFYE